MEHTERFTTTNGLTPFEQEAVRMALVQMFRSDGYFSICVVDDCLKLTRAVPDAREYAALRTLHCVSFAEMTPAMRQMVAERTVAMIGGPGFDLPTLDRSFLSADAPAPAPRLSFFDRAKRALSA